MTDAFAPPPSFTRLRTVDAHTAGEPLRVVVEGWPEPEGDTILAKRRFAREHQDHLRRALMLEPRGHADMYGCLLTRPVTDDGDVGVLFLHNEGYSTMCGHGIIGLTKVGLELGLLPEKDALRIDTPAGRVTAFAERDPADPQRVVAVRFENVPSFLVLRDARVDVEGLGDVRFDLGYGGAFYAYVDAADLGLDLEPSRFSEIVDVGMRIKRAVAAGFDVAHPSQQIAGSDLDFLYGTIFVGPAHGDAHSRNVCVFADGEVDRSPTGTGVSGRAALHVAKRELDLGEWITIESLIGTTFDVRAVRAERVGGADAIDAIDAIVPEVRGAAHLTGRHEFWVDPDDPLRDGILLR